MNEQIKMHDLVALLQQMESKHFETGKLLRLRRGQIGTVVTTYPDGTYEVEFADHEGRAFAILTLNATQIMTLHDNAEFAAA